MARFIVNKSFTLPPKAIVASFTFDDTPQDAESEGARLLSDNGVKGTFYISAAMAGQQDALWRVLDQGQIRSLARTGHEIGCHTAHHVNVQSLNGQELIEECRRNREIFFEICGEIPVENFAYPFGDIGLRQKAALQPYFDTCRSIYDRPAVGTVDMGCLPSIALMDSKMDGRAVETLLSHKGEQGRWLIFYTHDVSKNPSPIGTSLDLLKNTIEQLKAKNIPILTMREALRYFGYQRPQPLADFND